MEFWLAEKPSSKIVCSMGEWMLKKYILNEPLTKTII